MTDFPTEPTHFYEIPTEGGPLNGCEACEGWRQARIEALTHSRAVERAAKETLVKAQKTEAGELLAEMRKELQETQYRMEKLEHQNESLRKHARALPVPLEIIVNGMNIKEGVQIMLDSLVHSVDSGSGFLDYREWCALRQVGHALGIVDLDELVVGATSSNPMGNGPMSSWPDPKAPLTDTPAGTEDE